MAKKKPKKLRPKRPPAPAKFLVGTQVRVKSGTTVPDFEDIPLGGWSGTITGVNQKSNPPIYEIAWNQRTLDAMHPVFVKRSERDDLEIESMFLAENDLEPDTGEPVLIEQPTQIVTQPLRTNDQDDRIRAILGLTSDDPMPEANEENLRQYHEYLNEKLTFPFPASYEEETGPFQSQKHRLTVTSLHDHCDEEEGLLCEALDGDDELEIPLAEIEAASGPHRQLVGDYSYWFGNWPSEDKYPAYEPGREIVQVSATEPGVRSKVLLEALVKTICLCGYYGAVLGAALASLEDAVVGAKIAAVLLALVGGWLGTRYGQMIGIKDRVKSGGWWRGICGAVMGAILGALLGVMLVAFKGTLLGGLAGGLLGWFLPARDKSIRMVKGVIGGAMLGVVVQGWHHAAEDAFTGMWIGGLAGAIAGPLLMLLLMVLMVGVGQRRPG